MALAMRLRQEGGSLRLPFDAQTETAIVGREQHDPLHSLLSGCNLRSQTSEERQYSVRKTAIIKNQSKIIKYK
jgi:hypothetical protein